MSSQLPELLLEAQLAKRQLEEVFKTTELGCDNQSSPITESVRVTIDRNEPSKRQRPAHDFAQPRNMFGDSTRNARRPKRSDRNKSDMTPSSFTLTLLLIATIAAAYTDRPPFWLLLGPVLLAAGFAMLAVFQQRPGWRSPFRETGVRDL
jgi:hypothetical protein